MKEIVYGDLTLGGMTCPRCCGRKGWELEVPGFAGMSEHVFLPCSLCYGTGVIHPVVINPTKVTKDGNLRNDTG